MKKNVRPNNPPGVPQLTAPPGIQYMQFPFVQPFATPQGYMFVPAVAPQFQQMQPQRGNDERNFIH